MPSLPNSVELELQSPNAHPLDGRVFHLLNTFDKGFAGPEMKYISFNYDVRRLQAVYNKTEAIPIKFHQVVGEPNVYVLESKLWNGQTFWIGCTYYGQWLYSLWRDKADAMPIRFEQTNTNQRGTYK